jgi:hypothetical protein
MPKTINLSYPPLGLAAADYVVEGLHVLPCAPGDKPPLWGLGWEDASGDPERIMEWWSLEPAANVGVACTGDLVVLDVDGAEGEEFLAELEARYGYVPQTREVATGRREGGRHLWFKRPEGLTEGWRYRGLELKASGYVLAPPSVHPSGRWYYLRAEDVERIALPRWLHTSPRPVVITTPPLTTGGELSSARLQAAGEAALAGELGKLALHPSEPGSHRHTALYAAAAALGHHVASGGLQRGAVEAVLWAAVPQLGLAQDAEAWHQVQSGLDDGLAEPYVPRERPMPAANGNGHVAPGHVREAPERRTTLRSRSAAGLSIRELAWLWDQRVPLGKLTILAGLAGQGKSLLTCWMAARASRGELDGYLSGTPVDVVLVSAEDDPEDTILPRLIRTGADLDRVHIVDVREPGAEGEADYTRTVALPSDTPAILEELRRTGSRLIILDPISGLLDAEVDNYKSQHVRRALGPIKTAAEETNGAVVLISHVLPKGQGTDALARLADSHAFSGLPRSMLVFGPDPEDELGDRGSSKVLALAKSNLAAPGEHGLAFTILAGETVSHHGELGYSASIRLDGASTSTSAELLADQGTRGRTADASTWLVEYLADGPRPREEVRQAAEAEGHSWENIRARVKPRVAEHYKPVSPGPYWWRLLARVAPVAPVAPAGTTRESAAATGATGATPGGEGTVIQLHFDPPEED